MLISIPGTIAYFGFLFAFTVLALGMYFTFRAIKLI
ncbi:MAG: cytochrome b6-f complex subunit PetL [Oscillatoria sp. PMC 1051.18]|nr:cytochrome b6-f complex subunit PetL [Oscillatoria salina]MBZ8180201.1 cytochrome B6-F complex subunit VI [Oscillatoria salina IIICB1]MEC4891553.1 cytochrome b6-f complex subunit PetL [Oscillatoria sp. PMC 1050.18]MEC5029663.1 cytochrome b6-f complex subunit PetL [Oscillatoria sp. PMC 1051.18]NET91245.1 cytochrome B6-F complex subunit VI [Kamptonema sp. SIO1D9]